MQIRGIRKSCRRELINLVVAKPLQGYNVLVSFSDNPSKLFVYNAEDIISMVSYLSPLKDKALFDSFSVDGGALVWDDTMDISDDDIYQLSIPYHEWHKKNMQKD